MKKKSVLKKEATLIIVDCQHDFVKGNMPVPGALKAIQNIVKLILDSKKVINKIVFTMDWHPYNHCSFKKNRGMWPMHCVQYSMGAGIEDYLFKTVIASKIPYILSFKGENPKKEEYGAFYHIKEDKRSLVDRDGEIPLKDEEDVIVCGIAGNYCVMHTIENILPLKPKVFLQGIASTDNGVAINEYIKKNNLEIIEL